MLLGCMKAISGFGAFIILIVGLGMTAITIYGFTNKEIFLNDTSERGSILGILMAADLIIVFGSLLGIYGIKKGNRWLIFLFQILVIIFLIVFFSLGIAAEVIPKNFFDGQCSTSANPTLALAYNTTEKADYSFCLTCTCNLKNSAINSSQYNPIEQEALKKLIRDESSGAQAWQNCPSNILLNITEQQRNMGKALGAIEEAFNCAGWCDGMPAYNLIYRFSDVNRGKPKGYCYNVLKQQVEKYANVVGVGSLITAAFLLLMTVINCCICCDPQRKKLNFRDRFVYMNDGQMKYSKI